MGSSLAERLGELHPDIEVILVRPSGLRLDRIHCAVLALGAELAVRLRYVELVLQRQLEAAQDEPGSHERFVVGALKLIRILEPRDKLSLNLDVVGEKVEVIGEAEISGRRTSHRRGMDLARLGNRLLLIVTDGGVPP